MRTFIADNSKYCHVLDSPHEWLDLNKILAKNQELEGTSIVGHMAWASHELLPRNTPYGYVTLLRDPFDHFRSFYRWVLQAAYRHPGSPRDYLKNTYGRNYFVRQLGQGSLDRAKEILSNHYEVFGVSEKFPEFLELVAERFSFSKMTYRFCNRNLVKDLYEWEDIREEFLELCSLDYQLYEWVKKVFDEKFERNVVRVACTQDDEQTKIDPDNKYHYFIEKENYAEAIQKVQYDLQNGIGNYKHNLIRLYCWNESIGRVSEAAKWMNRALEIDAKVILMIDPSSKVLSRDVQLEICKKQIEDYSLINCRVTDSPIANYIKLLNNRVNRLLKN